MIAKSNMEVIKAPNPKLRIKTKPVKKVGPALADLTGKMIRLTGSFKDPEGVGLASTQIGLDECFFVGKIGKKGSDGKQKLAKYFFKVFINPKILSASKRSKKYFEGCLSIPDYYGEVNRSLSIKVSYQDLEGKSITENLKGVDAWIFQHEVDHLNGVLFPDRVLEQKGRFFKFTGKDKTGADTFEEMTI